MTRAPVLALVGPTGSGKTAASVPIGEALGAEIVNIDANLVYRGMDVWTGKPSIEERKRVPHHLIDLVDPIAPIGVAAFQRLARGAIADIQEGDGFPLLVGASGLYYRAIVDGLRFPGTERATRALLEAEADAVGPEPLHSRLASFDPDAAGRIHARNSRRTVRALEVAAVTGRRFSSFYADWEHYPTGSVVAAGIDIPRPILYRRIEELAARLFTLLLEETQALLDRGFGAFVTSPHVIGYAEAGACLAGEVGPDRALAMIAKREKALARRQLAWFRRDPRIRWFPAGSDGAAGLLDDLLEYFRRGARSPVRAEA